MGQRMLKIRVAALEELILIGLLREQPITGLVQLARQHGYEVNMVELNKRVEAIKRKGCYAKMNQTPTMIMFIIGSTTYSFLIEELDLDEIGDFLNRQRILQVVNHGVYYQPIIRMLAERGIPILKGE